MFVIFATLTIRTTTTWGTGSGNRITCTVDSNMPLPSGISTGTELNGIFAHINGTTFRAQNNTGLTLAANNNFDVSMTYLTGGGYSVTSFMSTFSRLAERWWEYVERKENSYSSNGESELLNRIAIEKRNSKRGKFGICGYSAAEHKESDRLGRGCLCGDRFSEHGFVGVRDAEYRDKRINHESFYDNKNHNGLCEIYRSRFIATTSERGWACA